MDWPSSFSPGSPQRFRAFFLSRRRLNGLFSPLSFPSIRNTPFSCTLSARHCLRDRTFFLCSAVRAFLFVRHRPSSRPVDSAVSSFPLPLRRERHCTSLPPLLPTLLKSGAKAPGPLSVSDGDTFFPIGVSCLLNLPP